MNIDPRKSIKELVQEYYDKGYREGLKAGEAKAAKELGPAVVFHDGITMAALPEYTTIRLDKKAELQLKYIPEKFQHSICVTSTQRQDHNRAFAFYSTADVCIGDLPAFVYQALQKTIDKTYIDNYRHLREDEYKRGKF